jgi:UDP-N-acetylglucosamine:LPS N-acetylglucosamine transferase
VEFVVSAGAGRYAPRPRDLVAEIGSLRRDPAALAVMRAASAGLSRPGAAADIARLLAGAAGGTGAAGLAGASGTGSALPTVLTGN